jgi:peptidoglycan/xylan/chitin deacetylase (PgdA/CDA1 family)
MSSLGRALLPFVAVSLGTWIGLGRPAPAAVTLRMHGAARPESSHGEDDPPPPVPARERVPFTFDGDGVSEPAPPWPQSNIDDSTQRAWLLSEGPFHPSNDGRRLVTFTFDDGPSPENEPALLAILDKHKIRAAFFFIGQYLQGEGGRAVEMRECARRIVESGHYVGNHTMHHRLLSALPDAYALPEIDASADAIERATGIRPRLFRPPYGALDDRLELALHDRKLELMLWNIDVQDMKRSDPDDVLLRLKQELEYHQGGIVLLHDVHGPSVKAFHKLLTWLESTPWDPIHPERRGWDIVDLAEYMRATAASPQPYASREDLEKARARRAEAVAGGSADQLPVNPLQTSAADPVTAWPSIRAEQ